MPHLLDDLDGLTGRAQDLLRRTGRRDPPDAFRIPTDVLRVRNAEGRLVPAPIELVVRRETFLARYGGLRYDVRGSVLIGGVRHDHTRSWDFHVDDDGLTGDRRGWCFSWLGPHVSCPVRFLAHSDGRVGVSDGGPFLEIAASVPHLIETHAMTDMVASWDPAPGALEPWVGSDLGMDVVDRLEGLEPVPEASGAVETWRLSATVAVRDYRTWADTSPRGRGVQIWTRGPEGARQVTSARRIAGREAAADRASGLSDPADGEVRPWQRSAPAHP
ncbi:hypothetical protein [Longispora urticae]